MSKRFRPNTKKPPKKKLECPSCGARHDHKTLRYDEFGSIYWTCPWGHEYSRPYEPSVYVFDKIGGSITVVTP